MSKRIRCRLPLLLAVALAMGAALPATARAAASSAVRADPGNDESAAGAPNTVPAAAASTLARSVPEAPPTLEIMAQFLEDYAARKTSAGGGWFRTYDPERKAEIKLQLVRVHRDRLTITADKTVVVGIDFKSAEGKSYDIDLWVNQTPQGLVVTGSTIHKVDGVPRYIWMEQEDHWELVPV